MWVESQAACTGAIIDELQEMKKGANPPKLTQVSATVAVMEPLSLEMLTVLPQLAEGLLDAPRATM